MGVIILKIIDVKTMKLFYKPKVLPEDGLGIINGRDALFVEIHTDEGLKGIGECASFWVKDTTETLIHEVLKPLLIGEDPSRIEYIWRKIYKNTFRHGRKGLAIIAMSGVDIALWDLLGKATNTPVYKLLGADKDKVKVYASAGYFMEGKSAKDLAEEMLSYKKMGFDSMKMKLGVASPKEDIERVKAVREAICDDVNLMLDANTAWDVPTAIKMVKILEEFEPYFLEEPVSTDDIDGSAKVNASTTIPIAGYETEYTRFGFKELILRRAIDIVQPDVTWSGGFTEARKIANLASAWNLSCIPHTYGGAVSLMAGLHFVAATPNALFLEWGLDDNPLRDKILQNKPEVNNCYIEMSDEPGLGIHFNYDELEKYIVE